MYTRNNHSIKMFNPNPCIFLPFPSFLFSNHACDSKLPKSPLRSSPQPVFTTPPIRSS